MLTFKITRYYSKYGKKLYLLNASLDGFPKAGGNYKTLAEVRKKIAWFKAKYGG